MKKLVFKKVMPGRYALTIQEAPSRATKSPSFYP